MAADLSKLWFLHEFIRKPKEFIHPKSTKTCGMPLAQALGELQNSAAFPRASHVASGLMLLSTGPGTKLQIPPFSYYSWPADLLLAFTVQQVAQTTPARALSRTLPRTVVKTWAQSNAWTEPREMQCTASAACVSEWVDVTKAANGTKSC